MTEAFTQTLGKSLAGALKNPNLSEATRTAYTQTLRVIQQFTEAAKPLIEEAARKLAP